MAEQLFTNNGDALMSGTLAQGGTSFTLGAGQGADFPAPSGGDYFLGTIYEKDGAGVETKLEVVKCTARTADTLTVVRDFESMTGQAGGYAYDGNTTSVYFSERWTAHAANQVLQKQDNLAGVADAAAALLNLGGAPLASPALTGTPTAPTAASGTNTTQIASTAFVTGAVADLVAASPAALDTLNELAAALGDDANFAATTATALGLKEVAANKDASGGYPGLTLFKLNLRNAANTITSWFTTAATVARTWTMPDKDGTVAMTSDLIGRNKVINGGFTVNQRAYVSAAALAAGLYGHDRWKAGASGGDYSFTQLASNTEITIASGKSLIQVIEDKNIQATSYVLSWTGTATARYAVNSATPAGSYAASPIVITGQTVGTVMSIEFGPGTVGKVQLEEGAAATQPEYRTYGHELALCQRYYYRVKYTASGDYLTQVGFAASTTTAWGFNKFPASMRVSPTALEQSGTAADYTAVRYGLATNAACSSVPTFFGATPEQAMTTFTVASGLTNGMAGSVLAAASTAYLGWSAEL